jgi:hypothetical protein
MKTSPPCDDSMWDRTFAPLFLGCSNITERPLTRAMGKGVRNGVKGKSGHK